MAQADFFTPLSNFTGVNGKMCCLTGGFEFGTKTEIRKIIYNLGGEVSEGMSRNVDVLVVGAKGSEAWVRGDYGTKIVKALDYNRSGDSIVIISERDFLDKLEGTPDNVSKENPTGAMKTELATETPALIAEGDFTGFDELTKAKIARDFIFRIAGGDRDALNDDEADDYFEYLLQLVEYEIKDHTPKPAKIKKRPFTITLERAMQFEYSDKPISITEVAMRIWELRESEDMYRFNQDQIAKWLVSVGLLENRVNKAGNIYRRPTDLGKEVGIITETRIGLNGNYVNVYYNRDAQEFIVMSIQDILNFNAPKSETN